MERTILLDAVLKAPHETIIFMEGWYEFFVTLIVRYWLKHFLPPNSIAQPSADEKQNAIGQQKKFISTLHKNYSFVRRLQNCVEWYGPLIPWHPSFKTTNSRHLKRYLQFYTNGLTRSGDSDTDCRTSNASGHPAIRFIPLLHCKGKGEQLTWILPPNIQIAEQPPFLTHLSSSHFLAPTWQIAT